MDEHSSQSQEATTYVVDGTVVTAPVLMDHGPVVTVNGVME